MAYGASELIIKVDANILQQQKEQNKERTRPNKLSVENEFGKWNRQNSDR